MPSTILECPHCFAEKIGFNIMFEVPIGNFSQGGPKSFLTMCLCTKCQKATIVDYEKSGVQNQNSKHSPMQCSSDPENYNFKIREVYPKPLPTKLPPYIPDNLKTFFVQASDALKRGMYDASGAMSRKTLDVSTQQLLAGESSSPKTIQLRIDALKAKGAITAELKDWAHQIRVGGNEASHDEAPYTQQEATELLDFVELYLTYVYSLPGRLAERRERRGKPVTGADSRARRLC